MQRSSILFFFLVMACSFFVPVVGVWAQSEPQQFNFIFPDYEPDPLIQSYVEVAKDLCSSSISIGAKIYPAAWAVGALKRLVGFRY